MHICCMRVSIYIYLCTHKNIYIYMYIYICIYIYAYIYIHIYRGGAHIYFFRERERDTEEYSQAVYHQQWIPHGLAHGPNHRHSCRHARVILNAILIRKFCS